MRRTEEERVGECGVNSPACEREDQPSWSRGDVERKGCGARCEVAGGSVSGTKVLQEMFVFLLFLYYTLTAILNCSI